MLPDTLLGLAVFAAGAGPGYLYVRLSEARRPRIERGSVEQAAELVVFGALSSGIAVLLTLALGRWTGLIDPVQLAADPSTYVASEPLGSLLALMIVIAVSYGAVWLVTTRVLHRGGPAISPGETAWYGAFHRMLPKDHAVYATVELRDGRAVAGLVVAYTPESDGTREIVLSEPTDGSLWLRGANGRAVELPDTFMIVEGSDIATVSGRYIPVANAGH